MKLNLFDILKKLNNALFLNYNRNLILFLIIIIFILVVPLLYVDSLQQYIVIVSITLFFASIGAYLSGTDSGGEDDFVAYGFFASLIVIIYVASKLHLNIKYTVAYYVSSFLLIILYLILRQKPKTNESCNNSCNHAASQISSLPERS